MLFWWPRSHSKLSPCRYIPHGKNEQCAVHFCCWYTHLWPDKHHKFLHPHDIHISLHYCVVTVEVRPDFGDRYIGHSQYHIEIGLMNSIPIVYLNQALVSKLWCLVLPIPQYWELCRIWRHQQLSLALSTIENMSNLSSLARECCPWRGRRHQSWEDDASFATINDVMISIAQNSAVATWYPHGSGIWVSQADLFLGDTLVRWFM